jgi:hypothetical protein
MNVLLIYPTHPKYYFQEFEFDEKSPRPVTRSVTQKGKTDALAHGLANQRRRF